MGDVPWAGDACSLVDAFRRGERSPREELEATLDAIEASDSTLLVRRRRRRATRPRGAPTSRSRSAACPSASRSSSRSPAGPPPKRRSSSATASRRHDHRRRATARRGRRGPGRAHDRQRVRRAERQRHQAQRRDPQPVAARPNRRWFVGRERGGRCRRARHARDRRRRRRFDPHPRRLHRAARDEGHVRPDPARPERVLPARTRSCSGASPGRCATRRATTTCARVRPDDPSSLPARPAAGRPASAPTTSRGRRVAILPALGGVDARARRRGAAARRGQARSSRRPAWSRSTSTSSSRTSRRSG